MACKGFSLIELMVVLVLVSLLGSLVLPGLSNAYISVSARADLEQMLLRLSRLGYEGFSTGSAIVIESEEDVLDRLNPPEGWVIVVVEPLQITPTGVCVSGEFDFIRDDFRRNVRITPPYCWSGNDS